jgi:3-methyladenine DNA glycosylase AlkD
VSDFAEESVARLEATFRANADADRAPAMAKYMKGHFAFLGIPSPERRRLHREALAQLGRPSPDEAVAAALALWNLPEREFQYAGADILAASATRLGLEALAECERLITTKSWWDTVDGLAGSVAGRIVLAHQDAVTVMERWIDHENMWLRRSANLHQLKWKERTGEERLFRYCLARAGETEFFIRKAIGWALRQHAKQDPDWVRAFVEAHEADLSPLSRREAMKHLG